MIRWILLTLLTCVSGASYATCSGNGIRYAPPINVDLSDKLSPATPEWTGTFTTQYSGSFSCTTNGEFGYTPVLSTNNAHATILGFNNNKYRVRAEITSDHPNMTLTSSGNHNASDLNITFTVRFMLVSQGGTPFSGDTANLSEVLFVTDLSSMSLEEMLGWPFNQLLKILQWLVNGFQWPYDNHDMFGQPMYITYAPKQTTCAFNNAGLTVTLPTAGVKQITSSRLPGLTPFTLTMNCLDIGVNGASNRSIEIFLSSNNLLSTDSSVLIDSNPTAAQGIGLRLIKRDEPDMPVTLSTVTTRRGTATALFSVQVGGALNEHFTIPMAVYYHTWNPSSITPGKINTSATLNIIYP